ncbi:hypothetical protein QBC39DRAFT_359966 [Podospora conica]|nr:hypothetical protein QBC39DRAFT_359966 [Schizothecium conicum]
MKMNDFGRSHHGLSEVAIALVSVFLFSFSQGHFPTQANEPPTHRHNMTKPLITLPPCIVCTEPRTYVHCNRIPHLPGNQVPILFPL